jgi:hypothetical protein
VSSDSRLFFWEAKNGGYWLMLRGFMRYRDIFDDVWDNYFCFVYKPTKIKDPSGARECPKYGKEQPATALESPTTETLQDNPEIRTPQP